MERNEKKFITELLSLYERHSCLWSAKSSSYQNKQLRILAYEELIKKAKEYYPAANKKYVTTKISNLRSSFRRELRRVAKTKTSGSGADDIYKPTLWYYDLLLFTAEDEIGRIGITSEDSDIVDSYTINSDNLLQQSPSPYSPSSDVAPEVSPALPSSTPSPKEYGVSGTKKTISFKRKKENLIELATKHLSADHLSDDNITGLKIGSQLKKMTNEQRILAEKFISEIMYYGQVSKLYEGCFQFIPNTPIPSTQTSLQNDCSCDMSYNVYDFPSTSSKQVQPSNNNSVTLYTQSRKIQTNDNHNIVILPQNNVNIAPVPIYVDKDYPSVSSRHDNSVSLHSSSNEHENHNIVILSQETVNPAPLSVHIPNYSSSQSIDSNKSRYALVDEYLVFSQKSNEE